MYPIIFQFGPIRIYSYGVAVACAFIVATFLSRKQAQRENIDPEKILNLSICLVVAGVLGARALYVLQNLNFYIHNPLEILMLHKGGLSFYGGFIVSVISALIFLNLQKLPILKTLSLVSPYLALAQAIGRVGCFLNGCCYGKPTSSLLSVYFPGESIARHPVQIYSSLVLLLIFVTLRLFKAKKTKEADEGEVFFLYCLLYSVGRFFIEYMRADNSPIFAKLTLHQVISMVIFFIFSLVWWRRCKSFPLKS